MEEIHPRLLPNSFLPCVAPATNPTLTWVEKPWLPHSHLIFPAHPFRHLPKPGRARPPRRPLRGLVAAAGAVVAMPDTSQPPAPLAMPWLSEAAGFDPVRDLTETESADRDPTPALGTRPLHWGPDRCTGDLTPALGTWPLHWDPCRDLPFLRKPGRHPNSWHSCCVGVVCTSFSRKMKIFVQNKGKYQCTIHLTHTSPISGASKNFELSETSLCIHIFTFCSPKPSVMLYGQNVWSLTGWPHSWTSLQFSVLFTSPPRTPLGEVLRYHANLNLNGNEFQHKTFQRKKIILENKILFQYKDFSGEN